MVKGIEKYFSFFAAKIMKIETIAFSRKLAE